MNMEFVAGIILFIIVCGYIFSVITEKRAKKKRIKVFKKANEQLQRLKERLIP